MQRLPPITTRTATRFPYTPLCGSAFAVHDRQLLDGVSLGSALGDIGDAAVEKGRLARQARIDGVGTFMRGAAPVAGLDLESLAHQFAAERGVIEITADDEAAGAAGPDETVDHIVRIARLPVGEARRGDLGHGYRADAARPERGIEAATLQVGGDQDRKST